MLVALDGDRVGGGEIDTQAERYATASPNPDHPEAGDAVTLNTSRVLVVAGVAVVAVWTGDVLLAALAVGVVAVVSRSWSFALLLIMFAGLGVLRADQAWASLAPDDLGPYHGWARVIDDPQPYSGSTRVILELDGERFELWSRGRARQLRVRSWRGGEWVAVSGTRTPLETDRAHRVAWQHVVGEFDLEWASDVNVGDPTRSGVEPSAGRDRASSKWPACR